MRASGNSDPSVCVQNLLKTVRGEVPYERIKGLDPTLIDQPGALAAEKLTADVEFVLETYEPRIRLTSAELSAIAAQTGGFALKADIK